MAEENRREAEGMLGEEGDLDAFDDDFDDIPEDEEDYAEDEELGETETEEVDF